MSRNRCRRPPGSAQSSRRSCAACGRTWWKGEKHHISPRYLQKLFESEGETVTGWIRRRRLAKCRDDLADPRLARHSIGAIGARHGLTDSSHFSKAFKEEFGLSPRDFRRSMRGATDERDPTA
ncbi:helix-turn-helix domain-containing protein [Rhodococcus sp. NPDC003318]|uniref:helix-turn-helix domain-containing protein n=1 Tax=Rhodococcus sp. NPDC003318 TaxID=3364503 RepID=UPI00369810E6